jgi:transporter family protein
MSTWLLLSMTTLGTWGLWAVFLKQATAHLSPARIAAFQAATAFGLAAIAVGVRMHVEVEALATGMAIAGGASLFFGNIGCLHALTRGPASVVVPLTSMYPVVTILLSLALLGESLSASQAIGVVLAAGAILAFSVGQSTVEVEPP